MAYDQPGLKKLVCPGKNELRPNARDANLHRGPLAYVPPGVTHVMDFGAPRTEMGQSAAPSSPTFTPGNASIQAGAKSKPLDATIQPGIANQERRKKGVRE